MTRLTDLKRLIAEGRIEFGLGEAIVVALVGVSIAVAVSLANL